MWIKIGDKKTRIGCGFVILCGVFLPQPTRVMFPRSVVGPVAEKNALSLVTIHSIKLTD